MSGGFDCNGFKELQGNIQKIDRGFDRFLRDFLLKQALDILSDAQENTHEITGLLRASWTLGDVKRVGDNLVISIINPTEYASYVEYGHMNRSRTKWVDGQFICTRAINNIMRLVPQRFNAEFSAWVRGLGV